MISTVFTKAFSAPEISKSEIYRYCGCRPDSAIDELIEDCICEAEDKLCFKVCYTVIPVGEIGKESEDFKKYSEGCQNTVIFVATIGLEMDRLINKYSSVSPAKALIMQALGAERIEALCDEFCEYLSIQMSDVCLKPRFSAGYGDLSLSTQTDIFAILGATKRIGVTLTQSLLMTPTKSVSGFIGIYNKK